MGDLSTSVTKFPKPSNGTGMMCGGGTGKMCGGGRMLKESLKAHDVHACKCAHRYCM